MTSNVKSQEDGEAKAALASQSYAPLAWWTVDNRVAAAMGSGRGEGTAKAAEPDVGASPMWTEKSDGGQNRQHAALRTPGVPEPRGSNLSGWPLCSSCKEQLGIAHALEQRSLGRHAASIPSAPGPFV